MADIKHILSEIERLEQNIVVMSNTIYRLKLELENLESENSVLPVFNEVIREYIVLTDFCDFVTQAEIFSCLNDNMQKRNPALYEKCVKLGWKNGHPANSFWRKFWRYLETLPNVKRIVKSKNDIRFYGLKLNLIFLV